MEIIKLSPRLEAVVKLAGTPERVLDVGTDHGYVPIYYAQNGCKRVAASDVRRDPLKSAVAHAREYGVQKKIEFYLTSGVQGIGSGFDTVIIAGMGGETVISILKPAAWLKKVPRIVIEPQSKLPELCIWLRDNGFSPVDACIVKDSGKLYAAFSVIGDAQTAGTSDFRDAVSSFVLNPLYRRRDPLLIEYIDILMEKNKRAIDGSLKAAKRDETRIEVLRERVCTLEKWRNRMEHDTTVSDIYDALCELAPIEWKYDFDNPGLLVGSPLQTVKTALVALDITDDVIDEATKLGAELIVSHHPLIFSKLSKVREDDIVGRKIAALIKNGISAICMHTNLDVAPGGVNDALADALRLHDTEPITIDGTDSSEQLYGMGRVGTIVEMDFEDFLKTVKTVLGANGLRYVKSTDKVNCVAVCGGAGGSELPLAVNTLCDTYVTADCKYNNFLDAKDYGINLIDAGHFPTENVVIKPVVSFLSERYPEIKFMISKVHNQIEQFYT